MYVYGRKSAPILFTNRTLDTIIKSTKLNIIKQNKPITRLIFNQSSLCNFIIGCWEIITLDSVQSGKVSGRLSDEQLHSLSQQISSSSAKYIALCLHHPPVSMQSDWDDEMSLENPDDLFAVIDQFDTIKAVMWGHAHQCCEFNRNGVKLFSCPSTALQFNGQSGIGYNHYTLNEDGEIYCKTRWL
jgi:Icc protein